jgi:microcystin-dependent protein
VPTTATSYLRQFPYRVFDELSVRVGDMLRRNFDAVLAEANPIGVLKPWAGASGNPIPIGWLLCDGRAVNRAQYQQLFATIGTTYGVGDGSTTFNLPDLRGRTPFGQDAAQTEFATIGQTGGTKTMSSGDLAVHAHTISDPQHNHVNAGHSHVVNSHAHGGGTGIHAHNVISKVSTAGAHTHNAGTSQFSSEPSGGSFTNDAVTNSVGQANTSESPGTSTVADTIASNGTGIVVQNAGSGTAGGKLPPYAVMQWVVKA